MALVSNTGNTAKVKNYRVSLLGFAGNGTSNFGSATDINCSNVEYVSLERPQKSANEAVEFQTNLRTHKDDSATQGWEDWSGMAVWADAGGKNWKAFVAAQECDATGTLAIDYVDGTSTENQGTWKVKIAQAGGGGGDASSFDTAFTPTIRLLESIGTGTATA